MKENEPLVRVHVQLYDSDLQWLRDTYRNTAGVSLAVRRIVRAAIKKMDSRVDANPIRVESEP